MSSSETSAGHTDDREVVSLSKHGQATIPKRFRERLGIESPGRVAFRETAGGEVIVEAVPSAAEIRERLNPSGEEADERPASEVLRDLRAEEKDDRTTLVDRIGEESGGE
ncbi:AbrB/MazE/SpoVT family DNA-binding domain-containing protein [Natronorarus salvus]|uniref:AbrB/MazE/SpoVT family DNA-binding domain-containing protein n=1 Tax=Natronorarus salvus TaxID=3117733 RepID=UPI002F266892